MYPILARHLYSRATFQKGDPVDAVDRIISDATSRWIAHPGAPLPAGRTRSVRLAALFDLIASLLYANDLITADASGGFRFRLPGISHREYVAFPYTWMCPLCIAEGRSRVESYLPGATRKEDGGIIRDFPNVTALAKPQSRAIGDVGFKILFAMLRAVFEGRPDLRICSGGGRRGEFDVTLSDKRVLMFGEVKAKPLVCFPITARVAATAERHEWIVPSPIECSLHVSAANWHIPLGVPDSPLWPVDRLPAIANDPAVVARIEAAWYEHLQAYRVWTKEPDRLRWLRFGCGNFRADEGGLVIEKRVANTKELPGLDRTDDIKKGTAQVLLFSRLKFGCGISALKGVLLGNTYAETHETEYLGPLSALRLIDETGSRAEYIFDAIVGLTQNKLNDVKLAPLMAPLIDVVDAT